MNEGIQNISGIGAHVRHAAPAHSRIANGGGAEEFQHRTAAHHRDVHDSHVPFCDPERLSHQQAPISHEDFLPILHGQRRQNRRCHILFYLRLVLS